MDKRITSYEELRVYQNAIDGAMKIFKKTKQFPPEEKYSMTDQIRRSSRSVTANLAEAWRKRRYGKAFLAKLNECESEAAETKVWIEMANRCGYLQQNDEELLSSLYDRILSQLVKMIQEPKKWIIK